MRLLSGFVTILAGIGCGAALAHFGILDSRGQRALVEVAFFVATPALMLVTIGEVRGGRRGGQPCGVGSVAVRDRWRLRRDRAATVAAGCLPVTLLKALLLA